MKRTKHTFVLSMLLAASGTPWAQAETATLADSASTSGWGAHLSGTFFYLLEVDGKPASDNAVTAMRRASYGRGAQMTLVDVVRPVPAGKVTLKLRAQIDRAAPILGIVSLFRRGNDPLEAEGTVQVELKPGGHYRIAGELDPFKRAIWIEDTTTGALVGTRIHAGLSEEQTKAMEGAVFTRTNLRYSDDWISDNDYPHLPFVPAGTRIKILDYSRNSVNVLVEGRKMRLGNDYGREKESMQQMVARVTVVADPRPRLRGLPDDVKQAIQAGRVKPGMTRDEAMLALGAPRLDGTPSTDAAEWMVHTDNGEEAFLVFGSDGRLKDVDASRKTRSMLLMPAQVAATQDAARP